MRRTMLTVLCFLMAAAGSADAQAPKKKPKNKGNVPGKFVVNINGEVQEFDNLDDFNKAMQQAGANIGNFAIGMPNAKGRKADPLESEKGLVVKFNDAGSAKRLRDKMQKISDGEGGDRRLDFDLSMDEKTEAQFFAEVDFATAQTWLKGWIAKLKPDPRHRALLMDELVLLHPKSDAKGDPTAVDPAAKPAADMIVGCLDRAGTLKPGQGRDKVRWRVLAGDKWFALIFPDDATMEKGRDAAKDWKPIDEAKDDQGGFNPFGPNGINIQLNGNGQFNGNGVNVGPNGMKKAGKKPKAKPKAAKEKPKEKKPLGEDDE